MANKTFDEEVKNVQKGIIESMKIIYQAEDGSEFSTKEKCGKWEEILNSVNSLEQQECCGFRVIPSSTALRQTE